METSITVNLKDQTCDVVVRGLYLGHISNLSTIPQAVAENLISALISVGMDSEKARDGVSRLLQETLDIQDILRVVPGVQ